MLTYSNFALARLDFLLTASEDYYKEWLKKEGIEERTKNYIFSRLLEIKKFKDEIQKELIK